MIKPVDEIPGTNGRTTKRAEIKADILEAIEKGISKFEFEGDYNWTYLGQYAREEAKNIIRDMYFDLMRKLKAENMTDQERHGKGFYVWWTDYWKLNRHGEYIKVTTTKGESRRRVFCEIHLEDLEPAIRTDFFEKLNEARTRYKWSEAEQRWLDTRDKKYTE